MPTYGRRVVFSRSTSAAFAAGVRKGQRRRGRTSYSGSRSAFSRGRYGGAYRSRRFY